MGLDADTFFRVLLFLVEKLWDVDTAPWEGDDADAELEQFVQKRWRFCKLLHPHDRRFKPGTRSVEPTFEPTSRRRAYSCTSRHRAYVEASSLRRGIEP